MLRGRVAVCVDVRFLSYLTHHRRIHLCTRFRTFRHVHCGCCGGGGCGPSHLCGGFRPCHVDTRCSSSSGQSCRRSGGGRGGRRCERKGDERGGGGEMKEEGEGEVGR